MISFVCKTYAKELNLAILATKTIAKFCKAEFEVVIFTDTLDEVHSLQDALHGVCTNLSIYDLSVFGRQCSVGYIDQQCIKLESFNFVSGENIFFYDSDMVFWRDFDESDFMHDGRCILPFAEWSRPPFLSSVQIRSIQKKAGKDFFFLGDVESYLRTLSENDLKDLGFLEFISNKYANVLLGANGQIYRWTTNYPDLMWSISSAFLSKTYYSFDTMRCHYMIKKSTLAALSEKIKNMYGSIWHVAYNRDILPVFSEFQIIGNFVLESVYGEDSIDYYPLPFPFLFSNHNFLSKIPVIKFNGKNHPISQYEEIYSGKYKDIGFKSELRKILGYGWD